MWDSNLGDRTRLLTEMKVGSNPTPTAMEKKLERLEMLGAVCKRPKMYTRGGTYWEVVAFLTGYSMGSNQKFQGFFDWTVKELNYPNERVWWDVLRRSVDSDEEAIKKLHELWMEYDKREETTS